MNYWADLEAPLDEAPDFYIEPADKDPRGELKRVVEFRRELRMKAPQCRIVAVPNAGNRGQKALNQARSEGAAWGFPDLMVLHEGKVAFLEFKDGKKPPADHQIEWMNWLTRKGFAVGVFRTADRALTWLHEQGFPVAEIRRAG